MASNIAQNMRQKAENLVMAFHGPWTQETSDAALADRAPECMHAMLPKSLGLAPKTNEDWVNHFKNVIGVVTNCNMKIDDVVVAADDRRVVIRSSQSSTTTLGPFSNEYVWFFTFDDNGEKITRIDEMLDSAASKEMMARATKAREERAKAASE